MINQKNQVIIISCCTVLVILIGLLFTFFGSFISQINTKKYTDQIKDIANNNLLFNKWILMIFIFNILIIVGYLMMYLQIGNVDKESGLAGDPGDQGEKGQDYKGCC